MSIPALFSNLFFCLFNFETGFIYSPACPGALICRAGWPWFMWIWLPVPPKCCDYRNAPSTQFCFVFFKIYAVGIIPGSFCLLSSRPPGIGNPVSNDIHSHSPLSLSPHTHIHTPQICVSLVGLQVFPYQARPLECFSYEQMSCFHQISIRYYALFQTLNNIWCTLES